MVDYYTAVIHPQVYAELMRMTAPHKWTVREAIRQWWAEYNGR